MSEAHFDHVVLLISRPLQPLIARYSRCDRDLTPQDRWVYFSEQVFAQFGIIGKLLAIVEDEDHSHPLVITNDGPQPLDAHMD